MTVFIKLSDNTYPLYEGDIRLEFSNIPEQATGDTFPCPDGYAKVLVEDYPKFNSNTHTVHALPPKLIDGQWRVFWSEPRPFTDEELKQIQIQIDANKPRIEKHSEINVSGAAPNVIS